MGSTGESATLSHAEHVEVIEAVVDAVEDVPVIAGTGSNNTAEALDLSQQAADAGADALLLISPYYNKPEPQGMYNHYAEIADTVDLPQIIYNVPSRTGRNIAVDTASNSPTTPISRATKPPQVTSTASPRLSSARATQSSPCSPATTG